MKCLFRHIHVVFFGDVDSSRSQLGIGWSGIATTMPLWSLQYAANHYCIDAAGDIDIDLPAVGFNAAEAQPGYWVTIFNKSAFVLNIRDVTTVTVTVIASNSAAKLIADSSSPNGWSVEYNTSPKASIRAGIDPTSNPDPFIGGLLVPANSSEFSIPFTLAPQSLGIADNYSFDQLGKFSVSGTDITVQPGNYRVSVSINIIDFGALGASNEGKILQLMRSIDTIYTAPPICTDSLMSGVTITSPLNAFVWTLNTTANFTLSSPETLSVRFIPNNTVDVIIALTSNISFEQL